eukprot:jgi/Chrpa1/14008/Chrysochromulina_OHIO_Genome00020987-RA
MFAALLRSATSRSTAVAAAALRLATRGMVGHTIAKKPHVGWPRLSRDGWPFARWLKKKGDFETKQAKARRTGMNKGREAQAFFTKISSGEPMYTSCAEVQPVVTAAGLRRPIAFPS